MVKYMNLTFMVFLVVSHIVDNKFYALICMFIVIVDVLRIRVSYDCDGLCILVDIPLKFHYFDVLCCSYPLCLQTCS
jgi:hypothetical protein